MRLHQDHQVQDMITRRVKYLELVHDHKMMFPSSEDGRNSVERTLTYVLKQLKYVLRNKIEPLLTAKKIEIAGMEAKRNAQV